MESLVPPYCPLDFGSQSPEHPRGGGAFISFLLLAGDSIIEGTPSTPPPDRPHTLASTRSTNTNGR